MPFKKYVLVLPRIKFNSKGTLVVTDLGFGRIGHVLELQQSVFHTAQISDKLREALPGWNLYQG